VANVKSGETVHALDPDRVSFTGSTRNLLSVGVALDALGAGTGSRPSTGAAASPGAACCTATPCSSAAATSRAG
jgi:hypothetical protein